MTMVKVREAVHSYIDELDDNFLKVVHAMLITHAENKDDIAGYDIYGNPKTVSTMQAELKAEVEAGKRGEGITHDELKKVSEEWLTRIR